MTMWPISLFTQSLFPLSLKEALVVAAEAGYSAIELACREPHLDLAVARSASDAVAETIRGAGLSVAALSLYNDLTGEKTYQAEIQSAATFIRIAPRLGTTLLKLTPGPPASALADEAHWQALSSAIAMLAPLARDAGVRLAFETHMRQLTDTLASSLRLLRMAPADVIGLTVDFSNMAFAGEDLATVIQAVGDRMLHAHIKNGKIDEAGRWHFGRLDEGLTDYTLVLHELRRIGYRGWLSVECLGPEARTHPLETVRRDLGILQQYVAGSGADSRGASSSM